MSVLCLAKLRLTSKSTRYSKTSQHCQLDEFAGLPKNITAVDSPQNQQHRGRSSVAARDGLTGCSWGISSSEISASYNHPEGVAGASLGMC
jgi:hypothetical protein